MIKLFSVMMLVGFGVAFSGPSHAFSLGDAKSIGKEVGKAGAEVAINKKLAKEMGKCKFKDKATIPVSGCDIQKTINILEGAQQTLKQTSNTRIYVDITVNRPDRKMARLSAEDIDRGVKGHWWETRVYYNEGPEKVEMKTTVY